MSTEQLPDGLQQTGINSPFNACMYRDDCRSEHTQRVTLQHHAADQAQRIAELEGERDEWKRIASAYSPQKELASALTQAKEAGRKARQERNELRSELDDAEVWRGLAIQFDGHRMQALWHLRALILSAGHADTARAFLAAPPLAGHEIIKERDELRARMDAAAVGERMKGGAA